MAALVKTRNNYGARYLEAYGYSNARRLGNTANFIVDEIGEERDDIIILLQ